MPCRRCTGRACFGGVSVLTFWCVFLLCTWAAAADGTRCVIPFRGDDMEWRDLRVMGDYGMVVPLPYSPRDVDSVRAAIRNSDIVINLIGKDYETTHFAPNLINYSFEDTHHSVAETIAKIAVEEVRTAPVVCLFCVAMGCFLAVLTCTWCRVVWCRVLSGRGDVDPCFGTGGG